MQLCLLVTVLCPGVRLIWKDFLHSKKQQDLIMARDPLQRAARLFEEPLSPGTLKNCPPRDISEKTTPRNVAFKAKQEAQSTRSFPSWNSRTMI